MVSNALECNMTLRKPYYTLSSSASSVSASEPSVISVSSVVKNLSASEHPSVHSPVNRTCEQRELSVISATSVVKNMSASEHPTVSQIKFFTYA